MSGGRYWIVVLRFAEVVRIDIVKAGTREAAIGDFVARCLGQKHAPELPLLDAHTSELPAARLREFAEEMPAPEWPMPEAPTLPVIGLCAAVRAYHVALADSAEHAEAKLEAFAEHYGVRIDFTANRGV